MVILIFGQPKMTSQKNIKNNYRMITLTGGFAYSSGSMGTVISDCNLITFVVIQLSGGNRITNSLRYNKNSTVPVITISGVTSYYVVKTFDNVNKVFNLCC